jgi:hypothetical protein
MTANATKEVVNQTLEEMELWFLYVLFGMHRLTKFIWKVSEMIMTGQDCYGHELEILLCMVSDLAIELGIRPTNVVIGWLLYFIS